MIALPYVQYKTQTLPLIIWNVNWQSYGVQDLMRLDVYDFWWKRYD